MNSVSRSSCVCLLPLAIALSLTACATRGAHDAVALADSVEQGSAGATLEEGQRIFRYDTFGDETQWTGKLRLHEVVNDKMQPVEALALGLKVDMDKLDLSKFILHNPLAAGGTRELLRQDAVVGLKATFDAKGNIATLGVTCALCHSTVDNAMLPGIGHRLDGWPNRDLDPGAIIAMSPALSAEQKAVYTSWGKGMYDPRYNQDKKNGPVVIPPAFGLKGVHPIIFTGDGQEISYWNRYVAVTQMGGHGTFKDPRIGTTGVDVTNGTDDLVSSKLPALQAYQISLPSPPPPKGSFNAEAAQRGEQLFRGTAGCAGCHSGPLFTDAGTRLHDPSEVVSEPEAAGVPSYASRSATKKYRTTPLKGVWQHAPYFHNGSAKTLEAVVTTYNERKSLGLSKAQVSDVAEYLKSL